MIRLRHKLFIQVLRLVDLGILTLVLALLVAFGVEKGDPDRIKAIFTVSYRPLDGLGLLLLFSAWALIFNSFVKYDANRFVDLLPQLVDVAKATALASCLLLVVGVVFEIGRFNRWLVLLFWINTTLLGILVRCSTHLLLRVYRRSGRNYRHLVIVGDLDGAEALARRVDQRPELGYKVEGLIVPEAECADTKPSGPWQILGSMTGFKAVLERGVVDEVLVTPSAEVGISQTMATVRLGQELGVVVRILPRRSDLRLLSQARVEIFEGEDVLTFFREHLIWHLLAKRVLDVAVSSLLILVLAPLFVAAAIAIRVNSPGPIFFVQERVGMNKRRFKMYKFRSMYADAEKRKAELAHLNEMNGPVFKIKNDPRITSVGRFLRKTSIDELPQLWNVVKGEMSLVGPRPPLPNEVAKYEWLDRRRLSIKPGITCLWQIGGRNELTFDQWMDLDRRYIETWSFWLDIQILLKTVPAVLFRKGAS